MDVEAVKTLAVVERVEAELDGFVDKRAREAREQERVEAEWVSSVKSFHQGRYRENCQGWVEYHDRQAKAHRATLEGLVGYHERERDCYLKMLATDSIPEPSLKLGPGFGEVA